MTRFIVFTLIALASFVVAAVVAMRPLPIEVDAARVRFGIPVSPDGTNDGRPTRRYRFTTDDGQPIENELQDRYRADPDIRLRVFYDPSDPTKSYAWAGTEEEARASHTEWRSQQINNRRWIIGMAGALGLVSLVAAVVNRPRPGVTS